MTLKETIREVIKNLSKKRPIFHSEADFQHALAMELAYSDSFCKIRLEHPFTITQNNIEQGKSNNQKDIYLDILCLYVDYSSNSFKVGIELKYLTTHLEVKLKEEFFKLKNQNAQDQRRYDFLLDIMRLEQLIKENYIDKGYAILLTNDKSYWKKPTKKKEGPPNDWAFRIHNGRKIEKTVL